MFADLAGPRNDALDYRGSGLLIVTGRIREEKSEVKSLRVNEGKIRRSVGKVTVGLTCPILRTTRHERILTLDLHPIIGQFRELKFPLPEWLGFVASGPQIRSAFAVSANCVSAVGFNLCASLQRSVVHRQAR